MNKFRAALNWLPHWVFVALSTFAGALGQGVYDAIFNGAGFPTTSAMWLGDLRTGLAVGVAALWGYLKTDPWTQASNDALAKGVVKVVGGLFLLGFLGNQVACTPAQTAVLSNIEQKVLSDVEAGKTLPQVEADVSAIVIAQGGTPAVVAEVLDAALALLLDMGLIPPGFVPAAQADRFALAPQLAARAK